MSKLIKRLFVILPIFSFVCCSYKKTDENNTEQTPSTDQLITSESYDKVKAKQSILVVMANDTLKLLIKPLENSVENITLTFTSKNLYTGSYDKGYLKYGKEKRRNTLFNNYRTTQWFPVLAEQGQSLVLSGTAHNRSTWQFKTVDGTILTEVGTAQKYKIASDVVHDKTVSKVDIPENAAYARVYYACLNDDDANLLDNRMQIEYGKAPTNYEPYETNQIKLPNLEINSYLSYEKGIWTLVTNKGEETLNLEALDIQVGTIITLDSSNTCDFKLTYAESSKDIMHTGVYGVRWNMNDSNPVCERIGDAENFHFNCVNGDSYITPYQNDFDTIYPWSDIKVCAVNIDKKGKRNITYPDATNFHLDGSVGNIMVEIPMFFCKREIIDDYEYLWISATEQDGFSLDPSFVTADGTLDHIYIGAYLSRLSNKKLESVSDSFPLIEKSMNQLQKLVKNSNGFTECDLLTILTVQRLYIVETAILDSQSLFTGDVYLPYLLKDKNTAYYAIKSEKAANHIFVNNTNMTRRFGVGDAISILNSWKEFKNIPNKYQREILAINDLGNETFEIVFTGDPVNIVERKTGITCIPSKNGETDYLPYITGSIAGKSGHTSFKYRGIENLWGSVSILLDHAYVKNSELFINYPTGTTTKLGYSLPVQNVQLSPTQFGTPTNMIVKRMGYDIENPLIMFPSEIGNGALTSGYYCDAWYNLGKKDVTYILTYGGAWDNKGYAGIFNFRASFSENEAIPFNGSRIMLR